MKRGDDDLPITRGDVHRWLGIYFLAFAGCALLVVLVNWLTP